MEKTILYIYMHKLYFVLYPQYIIHICIRTRQDPRHKIDHEVQFTRDKCWQL